MLTRWLSPGRQTDRKFKSTGIADIDKCWKIMDKKGLISNQVLGFLNALYGMEKANAAYAVLHPRLKNFVKEIDPKPVSPLNQVDVFVITYGDQFQASGQSPLETLAEFCQNYLMGSISGVHILPFFPSSSDDGFSVIDYHKVDPMLGDWDDISLIGNNFRLMFDAVINHVSSQSDWFQKYLQGDPKYQDYFIALPPDTDLSVVVRPRTHPLLTPYPTSDGDKNIWTTFSADQIDFNVSNPDVMLEIIDILLFYVAHGAQVIRLDAIAYLWKEVGTPCIHLPKTHWAVRLMRAVLDVVAPHVVLITETNVAHRENISYFGNGYNEAQLVYNFALPPLLLYTFFTADARKLSEWAAGLTLPTRRATFFNFLASHDGIGLNPVRGILKTKEIDSIVQGCILRGGLISSKSNSDGSLTPYEININYFDALSDPNHEEPSSLQIERFMTAHAILLSLVGVPGIYIHSLMGSTGWRKGVALTGRNRTINRQKFYLEDIEAELSNPQSLRSQLFNRFNMLLKARAGSPAFDPFGAQVILGLGDSVFTIMRIPPDLKSPLLCLHNVSRDQQSVVFDLKNLDLQAGRWGDMITGKRMNLRGRTSFNLEPYQTLWLKKIPLQ
jgi:glycosidase